MDIEEKNRRLREALEIGNSVRDNNRVGLPPYSEHLDVLRTPKCSQSGWRLEG